MRQPQKQSFFFFIFIIASALCSGQLTINANLTPEELAQKLTGSGVQVFNVHFTGERLMGGAFYNEGNTNINIDSGIVLTTGRAATARSVDGVVGNGVNPSSTVLADNAWGLPGDADIAAELGADVSNLYDACVLEFDFIPIGDSISFRYVFSSEEYVSQYVCSFNDAFAFFISGPGITGSKNIALVPGTNTPVSIINVNNVEGVTCNNNPLYYVDNSFNNYFTHDGHTKVLIAAYPVTSCQTYHLKLVITDVVDDNYDSGVFLEAKSLTSKYISLNGDMPFDPFGKRYVVEGCSNRRLRIKKPFISSDPANVILQYSGTAINGTDVDLLPTAVVIPAGQSEIFLDIKPIIDNIDEGTETLKITALYNCNLNDPVANDSIEIQVRDYGPLQITPDSAVVCRNQPVQLVAAPGYTTYRWDNNSALSNLSVANPIAIPRSGNTTYYCTAATGNCKARDSVFVMQKKIFLATEKKVTCRNSIDGAITMSGGPEWQRPLTFSYNNGPFNNDSIFTDLPKGNYFLQVKDATGCTDTLNLLLDQLNPDPVINNITTTAATCSGLPDGTATVAVSGGVQPYYYSLNDIDFFAHDTFNLFMGNYTAYVKDSAGCTAAAKNFTVVFVNTLRINTIGDTTVCEGQPVTLLTDSDGDSYSWQPSISPGNDTLKNPVATPGTTTKYFVTAKKGLCTGTDSLTVFVNEAPVANAGEDQSICYNTATVLHGEGAASLKWHPADQLDNDSIATPVTDTLLADTYFSLLTTDAKGCISLKADTVKITVKAPPKVFAGEDTVIAINQPLQLSAKDVNNSGFTNFRWSPPEGLSDPFIANPVAKITSALAEYVINTSTPEGCPSSDTINISTYRGPEIYVANAFTPNRNVNNILHINAPGFKYISHFNIYNRWGQLVFEGKNAHAAWDGKYKGKNVLAGTYTWMAAGVTYSGLQVQRRGTVIVIY